MKLNFKLKIFLVFGLVGGIIFSLPLESFAEGIISCDGSNCGFSDVLATIQNIINYLIIIGSVFAAISFIYAGFLYLFSMGNSGKISQATEIFKKVAIGYIIMLSAWLIVYSIEKAILSDTQLENSLLKEGGSGGSEFESN